MISKRAFCGVVICGFLMCYVLYESVNGWNKKTDKIEEEVMVNPGPTVQDIPGPLAQDDPRVIQYIKENAQAMKFLVPPADPESLYNLEHPEKNPSMGQSNIVLQILGNMKNGFFVECGGLDGETRSNTLDLERNYGWKGLLIEADPKNFQLLTAKNRKVWSSNTCLATKPYPHKVAFKQAFNVGKISKDLEDGETKLGRNQVLVQCFPFYSLLAAMNVQVVDYFSLDVEGLELQVLKTIPFDKIVIKVLSVEYIHDQEGAGEIEDFMRSQKYRVITQVNNRNNWANDLIFAHESVPFSGTIPPVYS